MVVPGLQVQGQEHRIGYRRLGRIGYTMISMDWLGCFVAYTPEHDLDRMRGNEVMIFSFLQSMHFALHLRLLCFEM
jgi:hypothetical protein